MISCHFSVPFPVAVRLRQTAECDMCNRAVRCSCSVSEPGAGGSGAHLQYMYTMQYMCSWAVLMSCMADGGMGSANDLWGIL